jgi:acetyl esterase/lipase
MSFFENGVKQFWKVIKRKDAKRLSKQEDPKNIKVISDIPYVKDAKTPNLLDIYYPEGTDKALPVIIDVHGGGWMYGNKELNKKYAMHLAARGFTVVNINYHLVQEERFPRQIIDIFAALNWIYENGKKYYMDLDKVFITGDSAGGHLTSTVLAIMNNGEIKKTLGVDTKLDIKAGGLTCGVFDFDELSGVKKLIFKPYGNIVLGCKKEKSEYGKMLSFKNVFNGKIVPLYLLSSRQDIIPEQTLNLDKFLTDNKVEHFTRFYAEKGKTHKLEHVFPITYPEYEESNAVNDEMCKFFLSVCDGKEGRVKSKEFWNGRGPFPFLFRRS